MIATDARGRQMHPAIEAKREALAALCRKCGVTRIEVFGSAARGADFDPARSDADFLLTFALRRRLRRRLDLADALEPSPGGPSTSLNVVLWKSAAIASGGAQPLMRRRPFMADMPTRAHSHHPTVR